MATTKSSKIFISESSFDFKTFFCNSKVPYVTVYQIERNYDDIHKKYGRQGGGAYFLI